MGKRVLTKSTDPPSRIWGSHVLHVCYAVPAWCIGDTHHYGEWGMHSRGRAVVH